MPADDPEFPQLIAGFQPNADVHSIARGIIVIEVDRNADSCGFVVPRRDRAADRRQLFPWAEAQQTKRAAGWERDYMRAENGGSIDGLQGLDVPDVLSDPAPTHTAMHRRDSTVSSAHCPPRED